VEICREALPLLGRLGWPNRDMKGGFAFILSRLGWPSRGDPCLGGGLKGGFAIFLGRLG
jgi:hypothetical protein